MYDPDSLQLDQLTLPDGRRLAWASCGDPAGRPVVYLHGAPACRLLHPSGRVAAALGVRLLMVSRPGYEESTFQPGRRLVDWPRDLTALADHLGLDRLALCGASAGGPYVAACARFMPERLSSAVMVSSFGPVDAAGALEGLPRERRLGVLLGRGAPWALTALTRAFRNPSRDTEAFFRRYTAHNCAEDQAAFQDPAFRAMFMESYAASCRHGVRGFSQDVTLLVRPWGFALEDIPIPVLLWHAEHDRSTPLGMAQAMAAAIPRGHLRVLPGGSHLLLFLHWRELLESLVGEGEVGAAR